MENRDFDGLQRDESPWRPWRNWVRCYERLNHDVQYSPCVDGAFPCQCQNFLGKFPDYYDTSLCLRSCWSKRKFRHRGSFSSNNLWNFSEISHRNFFWISYRENRIRRIQSQDWEGPEVLSYRWTWLYDVTWDISMRCRISMSYSPTLGWALRFCRTDTFVHVNLCSLTFVKFRNLHSILQKKWNIENYSKIKNSLRKENPPVVFSKLSDSAVVSRPPVRFSPKIQSQSLKVSKFTLTPLHSPAYTTPKPPCPISTRLFISL